MRLCSDFLIPHCIIILCNICVKNYESIEYFKNMKNYDLKTHKKLKKSIFIK